MKYLVYCGCIARGASSLRDNTYMHKPFHGTYPRLLHFCLFVVQATGSVEKWAL